MKKPILSNILWILTGLSLVVSGVFVFLEWFSLTNFGTPTASVEAFEGWFDLNNWTILVSGVLLLLFTIIPYMRGDIRGWRFIISAVVTAGLILLNWYVMGRLLYRYEIRFDITDGGINYKTPFGLLLAIGAAAIYGSLWFVLYKRRKNKAMENNQETETPLSGNV